VPGAAVGGFEAVLLDSPILAARYPISPQARASRVGLTFQIVPTARSSTNGLARVAALDAVEGLDGVVEDLALLEVVGPVPDVPSGMR
jgi:hypothetical protein